MKFETNLFVNVSHEMKAEVANAVKESGLTQGEWIRRAISAALKRKVKA